MNNAVDNAATVDRSSPVRPLAIVLAGATFVLVFLGGTVTSNDAGLAIPDWPTSEGHNMFGYPLAKWVGVEKWDKFVEHSHRLWGALVGIIAIVFAVWTQLRERRAWMKIVAWLLLGAVIVQGVMGGLRVSQRSLAWAVVHGCFAQLFFAATVCMVLFTSRVWLRSELTDWSVRPSMRRVALVTAVGVFAQLVAGAVYRHAGVGLEYHVTGAVVVTLLISCLVLWVTGDYPDRPLLVRFATLLGGMLVVQLLLGIGAYVFTMNLNGQPPRSVLEWVVPTAHVALGAAILAVSVALTVSVSRVGTRDAGASARGAAARGTAAT